MFLKSYVEAVNEEADVEMQLLWFPELGWKRRLPAREEVQEGMNLQKVSRDHWKNHKLDEYVEEDEHHG